jgi:hypothetical protein
MNINYIAGEDLKKGDRVALARDGKIHKTKGTYYRIMLKDIKAGDKVDAPIS